MRLCARSGGVLNLGHEVSLFTDPGTAAAATWRRLEGRTAVVVDDGNEVYLLVPSDPAHLRTVRLVAADAGGRAGLDASEIDDLRIAVGELCQAVIESTDHRLVLRVVVHGESVIVRGSARRRSTDPVPRLSVISELIVDAVSDHYCLEHSESEMIFAVSKTAGRLSRA